MTWFLITSYVALSVISCWWISAFISEVTACIPLEAAWTPGLHGKCINDREMCTAVGMLHIVFDSLILFLPIPLIWKLRIPNSARIAITLLFGVGILYVMRNLLHLKSLTDTILAPAYARFSAWHASSMWAAIRKIRLLTGSLWFIKSSRHRLASFASVCQVFHLCGNTSQNLTWVPVWSLSSDEVSLQPVKARLHPIAKAMSTKARCLLDRVLGTPRMIGLVEPQVMKCHWKILKVLVEKHMLGVWHGTSEFQFEPDEQAREWEEEWPATLWCQADTVKGLVRQQSKWKESRLLCTNEWTHYCLLSVDETRR